MEKDLNTEKLKFKIPPIYYILIISIIIIAAWIIVTSMGWITVESILLDFIGFISMLVVIFMLAVLGAVFLGMYISHRILSAKGFSPFERAMLEMREDMTKINERLGKIEQKLSDNPGKKKGK
ncbi:MAG: hypothetical protein JSV49_02295 [Thermoplasmata archaeon]|nr:MAG: hypothetical protein JSV49_02295 [Thermoplasmata archaeon]